EDLRIEDNPALAAAAKKWKCFTSIYLVSKEEGQFTQSLKSLGAELVLIKAQSTLSALTECVDAVGATKVVYNHLYGSVKKCSIEEVGLEKMSQKNPSNALLGKGWAPGWSNANQGLNRIVENNLVAVRLKQIFWTKEGNSVGEDSASIYLRAIGLREYSRYICFNFPFTHERSLLNNLKFFPWNADQTHFKAWRQGRDYYPLVDAGMRELWATGWYTRIPFLDNGDLESDIIGWQYISGSLPDGHELERLDNPEVQGFNYDPEGEYVRHWLPELARMPAEWIHHPWDAPLNMLRGSFNAGYNYHARKEAAVNAADANGTIEVVFINSENGPGGQSKDVERERCLARAVHLMIRGFHRCKNGKQMTVSRNSFSVPQAITMSHDRKSLEDEASSHVKLEKEEEIDTEINSCKNGKTLNTLRSYSTMIPSPSPEHLSPSKMHVQ
ncbi:Cryptochrome-2, partial [Datura stramonium]|nr:Cryptochrome-2 [Datura stramonium]